jgi:hypothetical protein
MTDNYPYFVILPHLRGEAIAPDLRPDGKTPTVWSCLCQPVALHLIGAFITFHRRCCQNKCLSDVQREGCVSQPPFERSFARTRMPMTDHRCQILPFFTPDSKLTEQSLPYKVEKRQSGLRRPPSACMSIPPDPPPASRCEPGPGCGNTGTRRVSAGRLHNHPNTCLFRKASGILRWGSTPHARRRHTRRGLG